MSINVEWDQHLEHLIHWEFPEKWTWNDFYQAFEIETELVRGKETVLHDSIAEFRAAYIPLGASVSHVLNALRKRKKRPGYGYTVIVTSNLFIITMMNTLKRVAPEFGETFLPVKTFEEGYELIRQRRGALQA